jgi:hypothetical protein
MIYSVYKFLLLYDSNFSEHEDYWWKLILIWLLLKKFAEVFAETFAKTYIFVKICPFLLFAKMKKSHFVSTLVGTNDNNNNIIFNYVHPIIGDYSTL